MPPNSSITEMFSQSRVVLTRPSVASFERFEKSGSLTNAITYVAIAAAITGIFGLLNGLVGFLSGVVATIAGFLIFTYLVFYIGSRRGGTGSFEEVAYSFALFWAPLAVVVAVLSLLLTITIIGIIFVPLVAIAGLVLNIYYAYLAVQASMNLEGGGPTWMVLILAGLASFVINLLLGALTGA